MCITRGLLSLSYPKDADRQAYSVICGAKVLITICPPSFAPRKPEWPEAARPQALRQAGQGGGYGGSAAPSACGAFAEGGDTELLPLGEQE